MNNSTTKFIPHGTGVFIWYKHLAQVKVLCLVPAQALHKAFPITNVRVLHPHNPPLKYLKPLSELLA
jgi:hypothetical protein